MKSPVYDVAMVRTAIHGVEVDTCPETGGVFLHRGELDKIAPLHEGDLEYSTIEAADSAAPSDLSCPACPDTRMRRVFFATYSKIPLDYCPSCGGLWVERNSLEAIQAEVARIERAPDTWRHALMLFLSKLPF